MSDMWTLYCSTVCFSSVLKRVVYGHYRKIGQETEKNLICEAPPLKKSNGIKYITRQSPQILNTGTYRKIFRDFSLAQMGDCMGIFNRPSDFSLAMGDWASGSLYPWFTTTLLLKAISIATIYIHVKVFYVHSEFK